jgi:hypothetical protein
MLCYHNLFSRRMRGTTGAEQGNRRGLAGQQEGTAEWQQRGSRLKVVDSRVPVEGQQIASSGTVGQQKGAAEWQNWGSRVAEGGSKQYWGRRVAEDGSRMSVLGPTGSSRGQQCDSIGADGKQKGAAAWQYWGRGVAVGGSRVPVEGQQGSSRGLQSVSIGAEG